MPFRRKGAAGLTERLDVRVAPAEKAQLRAMADAAGIGVAELVRQRALGRPVVSRTDATTIRELRRLGGLLKMVHVESGGAYSRETAAALAACAPPSAGSPAAREARRDRQEGRHGRRRRRPRARPRTSARWPTTSPGRRPAATARRSSTAAR